MKHILGLDLGTTSIGFAHVIEGDTPEQSAIKKIGVRIIPLTTDEQTNFEKGKPFSVNAERTLKRGMRRNLDRYQLRRQNLIEVLKTAGFITAETKLAEDGKHTTHETWRLRAKAVEEKIQKHELARVFLSINKKRGYKSSRKTKSEEDGQAIDGMAIAKKLYEENLTPGQLVFQMLAEGKRHLPDFYSSDLQAEFQRVWNFQKQFYPDFLTEELFKALQEQGKENTRKRILAIAKIYTAEIKDLDDNLKSVNTVKFNLRDKKRYQAYYWRSKAVAEKLEKEQVAFVLAEINGNLASSSGLLGAISDRSKELYFNKQTVGQYLFDKLKKNPHTSLKNQVFYRQDYLDEFERIWATQSQFYPELTPALKEEIRDITIFYQRKLKSQKGLVSFCEFEREEKIIDGKKKLIGAKVAPKSSPLFQEFKIWQVLHNVTARKKGSSKRVAKESSNTVNESTEIFELDAAAKQQLFNELNIKGNIKAEKATEILGHNPKEWELNYPVLEGNRTNSALYNAYLKILELEGYDVKELLKVKSNKEEIELEDIDAPASEIKKLVKEIFNSLNIHTEILDFNAELDGKAFEQQASYQLWHLLYSYEGDDSQSGNEKLYELLQKKFGFNQAQSRILANVSLSDDFGNLSAKAIRRIYPFIKENKFSKACELAGYRHSASSLTKEEIESRTLDNKLELLKKNSLRNPVVEKILNQMVNVVNTLITTNSKKDANGNIIDYFKFDEVRIELARELKKSAKERAEMTSNINTAKAKHEKIVEVLQREFNIANPSRNDIIRYKLYEELKNNGYKDLYTNEYIPRELLFTPNIDVDHIIPQARLFDDSFSNKTVVYRKDNLKKGNRTAIDYIEAEYGSEKAEAFLKRIEMLFEYGKKNVEEGISKAKFLKLQKRETEIGDGFIERDLRDSQYIAKKAKEMLLKISPVVVPTSGSITDRLREDWGLVNIMQELNFEKFKKLGLTEKIQKKDGSFKERIVEWNKRNDHRHHAMDALTVAFTKHSHIQYLNYLNARFNETHKEHKNIKAIEEKETHSVKDENGNNKRLFNLPIANFRQVAKEHLEHVLVSHKAKNKVVTKNKNKIKTATGVKVKTELTPRGQLHKETVYGKYKFYVNSEEKVSSKFDLETVAKVSNPQYKALLLQRLAENDNDPKKAFAGKNALSKNPIYLNAEKTEVLPEKVKLTWLEEDYSIRKDITPENFKDEKAIEKVIDEGVKQILLNRLKEYGDPKKAFSDLEKNPIRHKNGVVIKRARISGVKNATPLHYKKNHLGHLILDKAGNPIAVDFVSTGSNHHVAIYRDENGNLQDRVVSFFEAVQLVNAKLPVVDKEFNKGLGWQFLFTMKQNEYFVFPNKETGFNPNEIDLLDPKNKKLISPNLFRVQTISIVKYGSNTVRDFLFRHHLDATRASDIKRELQGLTYHQVKSLHPLNGIVKVRLNHLGDVVKVGEY